MTKKQENLIKALEADIEEYAELVDAKIAAQKYGENHEN